MSRPLVLLLFVFALPLFASDVTVAWIARAPELEYVWGSAIPGVEGWPLAGSTVTWRAHVRNFGPDAVSMPYAWRVDGVESARGNVILAPNAITTVDLPSLWTFDRHRIAFTIDGKEVEVFSDALSVGFWVEQSFYDYFRAHQSELGIGSTGFEDWAQRTVALFNDMAELAGVIDRMRLQKIVIVPDGALPLNGLPPDASLGANGATHPDQNDRTVDLMWGFRTAHLNQYTRGTKIDPLNWFYTGVGALHEMGHARYLVDVYAWDVRHAPPYFVVEVPGVVPTEAGGLVHRTPEQGLMNKHYSFIDEYSALALNRIAGHRATLGNYNEPRNFASFLNDMPAQNRVTIRDENGVAIPNADVEIYQATRTVPTPLWYGAKFDATPDLVLHTDDRGRVLVGRSPFGTVVHAPDLDTGVVIVRVNSKIGYLESRLFNLAYWRGETEFAAHELMVGRECGSEGPRLRGPSWDENTTGPVTLEWDAMVDATHYRVYANNRLIASTTRTSIDARLNGRVYWWVEADLGVCGTRRSYPGRFLANNGTVVRRRAAR
ncbi:MAG TPA: hypothetical protein VM733_09575 [Thermoanaerobaculia bacterium]|nr:hypothetical protein [Thermoanaerobaculia bacterium]